MKNLILNRNSRKQTHKTASLRKDILKTIIFSLPILALGASFIFAKTSNADAASDIVVKITTQGTGYIKNVWNSIVNYTGTGTCPASGTLNAFERVDVSGCSVGDTMTISEGAPGTSFRQWANNNTGQYAFFGNSNYAADTARGEITQMPPMNSFTTDSTGTTAGDNFFSNFNYNGALTSLPASSFNTGNITTVGNDFFNGFNSAGSLTSLPAGSFNTSNITTAGGGFFALFNYYGALTSLPAGSFDISKITTTGNYFFYGFNSGDGKLTKASTGIPIKNVSSGAVNFQSWNGASSDTDTVNSGDTFEFYAVNAWNYTINADSGNLTGGTVIGVIDEGTLVQLPTTATRAGYTFAGFTSSAWTGTKNLGETFTLTGDTEITATWTKNADPAPAPTPTIPAAPNTGSTNKLSDVTISGLIFASIIAAVALFAKFAHKTLKSER